jgi:hypothetical protein
MPRRDVQVHGAGPDEHGLRRNDDRLAIDHRWSWITADVDATINARLRDADGNADIGFTQGARSQQTADGEYREALVHLDASFNAG